MPDRMQRSDGTFMRNDEWRAIQRTMSAFDCCALVGISNVGKSALLRAICLPEFQAQQNGQPDDFIFVYVDCNHMLTLNDQGFYELILRCLHDTLQAAEANAEAMRQLRSAYESLINPHSPFHVPLSFNQGITAVVEGVKPTLVLVLDEFDEVLTRIEGRVLLNLRALKDQYRRDLNFVIATNERPALLRRDAEVDEFTELFAHHTLYLAPLNATDAASFIQQVAGELDVTFDERDTAFVFEWSGGHIGLMEATCGVLAGLTGAPVRDETQDWLIHREAAQRLPRNLNVQTECHGMWATLSQAEQQALLDLVAPGGDAPVHALNSLRAKHVILGNDDEAPRVFCRLFGLFIQQQSALVRPGARGVRLDVETGKVVVDGRQTEELTNLEYRLLLLLYGQIGKICDKYQVVEAVWGQDYIDTVDDARIEKLVSRLRAKIEPEPGEPRYILTIRGRGYKLVGPG